MHQRTEGLLAIYVAMVLLAINGVLSKTIPLDAITVTCLRCGIAFVALLAFAQWQRQPWGFRTARERWLVVGLGVLMGIHWSCFFKGMQVSSVAIGILAHYTTPVVTVTLEPLLDKRWPKSADVIAALIVLAGLAIMVPDWHWGSQTLWGIVFGVCSALTLATRNVFQRRWLNKSSSVQAMVIQVFVAALVCAPFSQFTDLQRLNATDWWLVLGLGLVSTAFAHTLIVVSLRHLAAKSVSLISCFQPPLAILLGWLVLSESPSIYTLIGGSLILGCALYEAINQRNPPADIKVD
ncbi:MAG TPA: DMT family transporter [Cellvibrionaceae bacterium]